MRPVSARVARVANFEPYLFEVGLAVVSGFGTRDKAMRRQGGLVILVAALDPTTSAIGACAPRG